MSFSPRGIRRAVFVSDRTAQSGTSVLAALILVGILALTASVIQMTIPGSPVSQKSQGAALGSADVTTAQPASLTENAAPASVTSATKNAATATVVCELGKDYSMEMKKDENTGTAGLSTPTKFQICPAEVFAESMPNLVISSSGARTGVRVACDKVGKPYSEAAAPNTCRYKPFNGKSYVLADGWKCRVRIIDTFATEIEEKCRYYPAPVGGSLDGNTAPPAQIPKMTVPQIKEGILNGTISPEQIKQMDLDPATQTALNDAFSEQKVVTETDLSTIRKENEDSIKQLAFCQSSASNNDASCTDENKQALTENLAAGKAKEKELSDQLKVLGTSQKQLDGGQNPDNACSDGFSFDKASGQCFFKEAATCNDQGGCSCPTGTSRDPITKKCLPKFDTNSGNTGGNNGSGGARPGGQNTFGGGSPSGPGGQGGQNPGAPSPFGGACSNRYVCSGNTLYYQTQTTMGGFNGSASCSAQPVQQCQYGCLQSTAQSQSGAGSTLGGITAGLQVFSSLSSLFGGGSNNSASPATNNLPSSCATQQQAQQQQAPHGTGTNGQACTQPPPQPAAASCTSGTWKSTSGTNNGCVTGWQCVPNVNSTTGNTPTAQLSCEPRVADVGMLVGFSFSCGNATGSTGTGFATNGALAGSSTALISTQPANNPTATYSLTCINQGVTTSAQCQVQVSKPGIIMVTNPQRVKSGETASIGWITTGMQSCVISSPDQFSFTQANANTTNVNGAATTQPITAAATRFVLDCVTNGYGTRQATTSVTVI